MLTLLRTANIVASLAVLSVATSCYPASLGAAGSTLALVYCQTRHNAMVGWHRPGKPPFEESNVILGRQPSPVKVDLYFVGVVVVMAAVQLLPRKYAEPVNWVMAGAESVIVQSNMHISPGACGL